MWAVGVAVAGLVSLISPSQLVGPSSVDAIPRDATTVVIELTESDVTASSATVTMAVSAGGAAVCETPPVAIVTGKVVSASFDLTDCALADLPDSTTELSLSIVSTVPGSSPLVYSTAELGEAVADAPWTAGLVEPLRWGFVAGMTALLLGLVLGWNGARLSLKNDPPLAEGSKKVRPGGTTSIPRLPCNLPWNLPAKPVSGIDFGASGTGGRLVFIGAAIAAVLALGDLLDSFFDDSAQLVLAANSVTALLVAGAGPLMLFGFQATYTPTQGENENIRVLADEQLVASYPGVVLGAAFTAAAMATQIAGLAWAGEVAGVDLWSWGWLPCLDHVLVLPFILGLGTTIYCVAFAASTVYSGRKPPILDAPDQGTHRVAVPRTDGDGTSVIVVMPASSAAPASVAAGRRLLP